jgi:hypothetical protein
MRSLQCSQRGYALILYDRVGLKSQVQANNSIARFANVAPIFRELA